MRDANSLNSKLVEYNDIAIWDDKISKSLVFTSSYISEQTFCASIVESIFNFFKFLSLHKLSILFRILSNETF